MITLMHLKGKIFSDVGEPSQGAATYLFLQNF